MENLKEWKMKDDECLEVLKSIELSMNRLTTLTEESRDEIKQLQQSALQLQNDEGKSFRFSVNHLTTLMNRLTKLTEKSHDEMKQLHQSALQQQNDDGKYFKLSVNRLTTLTEESRDEMKQLQSTLEQQNDDGKSINLSMNCLTTLLEESRDAIKQLHQSALQQQNDQAKSTKLSIDRLTTLLEESPDAVKQLQQSVLQKQNEQAKEIARSSQVTLETKLEKNCCKKGDKDIFQKLAKHNFKSKIQRKVKFFCPGTREWLLKKVDDWFTDNEQELRVLVLTAGPGFGKSVFAAKVCEDFKGEGKLAACHYCDFSDSNLRDPMTMLQSIASQMCEDVAGFKEKLLDQLKRPYQVKTLKDAFGIYLQNPLVELGLEEPILVVIDGLDRKRSR